jgi:hypothetical protein
MDLSKIINALSLVAVLGAAAATTAEAIDPQVGAIVGGIAGIAGVLSKTFVTLRKPGEKK